jgi:hypothetical protein
VHPVVVGFVSLLYWLPGLTSAQVNKCVDAAGNVTYLASPCPEKSKANVVKLNDTKLGPDSQIEAKKLRDQRQAIEDLNKPRTAPSASDYRSAAFNQGQPPGKSDQHYIDQCKAQRGTRCDQPSSIANQRQLDTPITHKDRQIALNERRFRESMKGR